MLTVKTSNSGRRYVDIDQVITNRLTRMKNEHERLELIKYLHSRNAPDWMIECARGGVYDGCMASGVNQSPNALMVDANKAGVEI